MEKDYNISILLDLYGVLLTEKQAEIMSLYFNLDNSLSEIADIFQISRQSVRDAVVASKNALEGFEKKLRLKEKFEKASLLVEDIKRETLSIECLAKLDGILDILEE